MYKCETCSKTYKTNERYQSHLKRCENPGTLRSRSNSIESIKSTQSLQSATSSKQPGAEVNENDLKRALKKLSKDRTKLKEELKKYSDELKKRVDDHRDEMERTQDYFQEQIDTLTDEKEHLKIQMIQGQQKDNNPQIIKRLENTIIKLQERLSFQEKEYLQVKNTEETHFRQVEEKLRLELKEKDEQLKKLVDIVNKERETTKQLRDSFNIEKTRFQELYDQEKQEEINKIIAEKYQLISTWEKKEQAIIEKINETERIKAKEIRELTLALEKQAEQSKTDKDNLKKSLRETLENERLTSESRIEYLKKEKIREIEELEKKHQDFIEELTSNYNKRIQEKIVSVQMKKEEIENENKDLLIQIEKIKEDHNTVLREREKSLVMEFRKQFAEEKNSFQQREEQLKKQTDLLIQDISGKLGEVTDMYEKLAQENNFYKTAIDRLKDSNKTFNDQFIQNLSQQSESHKLVLQDRDTKISELERELIRLQKDCVIRLNSSQNEITTQNTKIISLEREINKLQSENSVIANELDNYKAKTQLQISEAQETNKTLIQQLNQKREEYEQLAESTNKLKQNFLKNLNAETRKKEDLEKQLLLKKE